MLVRVFTAALLVGMVGFLSGYFGPIYLLENPGLGPLTGFLVTPVAVAAGAAVAAWTISNGSSRFTYVLCLTVVGVVVAGAILVLVLVQ